MRIVIVLLAFGLVVAVVGWPLYVAPAHDEPRAVDAVYVIGPPTDERIALAEGMIADGLTDTLVISLIEDPVQRAAMPAAAAACDEPQDFTVLCSQPAPFTTRGEARWLRDLVDDHGWQSVAVVTVTPHVTRTRVIMERCWDGDISYLESGESLAPWQWAYQYAYQSAAFVKVAWEDGC
ncbi:hypothetical protein [Demequina gelatinilytica]|uniref:hypothetical protein n=1 Tax=Demequina gelatinilytica TaxID=1638980 RepID=UPI000782262B|nr:hypothetical protein [Demequina gelatinilytica]